MTSATNSLPLETGEAGTTVTSAAFDHFFVALEPPSPGEWRQALRALSLAFLQHLSRGPRLFAERGLIAAAGRLASAPKAASSDEAVEGGDDEHCHMLCLPAAGGMER